MSPWLRSPVRRAIDLIAAMVLLIVSAPLFAATAFVIRIRLGSPVLFRQERSGRDASPIMINKFRSMSTGTDTDGTVTSDDERLSPFGRRLRRSSLDELPQLWNVVRGDMSLIGPRPLPVRYVRRYSAHQAQRLVATPGMTGWSQVHGRNALSWPAKLDLDVWYVEHASWRVDVRILLATFATVVRRVGISVDGHATSPEFVGDSSAELERRSGTDFGPGTRPAAIAGIETAIFDGEAVLFDEATSLAHQLDGFTAAVWLSCDGATTVEDITEGLAEFFETDALPPVDGEPVRGALGRLADSGLLVGSEQLAPPPCIGCGHD